MSKGMKHTQNPTLSAYLLEKANRFLLYPRRISGTRADVSTRKMFDQLRHKMVECQKTFGKNAIAGTDFIVLINDYGSRAKTLSREGRDLAHKVRIAGNDVLHQQNTGSANALEVIEAARVVILELVGATARPGATSKG